MIGARTAYFLSFRGIEVIVIERAEVAAAASGKAGGFWASTGAPTPPRNATHGEPSRRRGASYEATDDGRPPKIKVERQEEVRPGVWRYTVPRFGLKGRSRQPCRRIKRIHGPTGHRAGLFREGRAEADVSYSVEWGAAHTGEGAEQGQDRLCEVASSTATYTGSNSSHTPARTTSEGVA